MFSLLKLLPKPPPPKRLQASSPNWPKSGQDPEKGEGGQACESQRPPPPGLLLGRMCGGATPCGMQVSPPTQWLLVSAPHPGSGGASVERRLPEKGTGCHRRRGPKRHTRACWRLSLEPCVGRRGPVVPLVRPRQPERGTDPRVARGPSSVVGGGSSGTGQTGVTAPLHPVIPATGRAPGCRTCHRCRKRVEGV